MTPLLRAAEAVRSNMSSPSHHRDPFDVERAASKFSPTQYSKNAIKCLFANNKCTAHVISPTQQ